MRDHVTDESDQATEHEMRHAAIAEALIRAKAAAIPVGKPGECSLCGEWSGRLVGDACAPCRDKWRIAE